MKMPPPIATKFTKLVLTILAITILGIILSFISQDHTLLMLSAGVAVAGGVKIIDYPTCSSVNDMKEKNKQEFFGTRDETIALGYSPCGRCKP